MERPLNIYVVEPRSSGGMIHYAYQLCTALAQEGENVTLVTAKDYEMAEYDHNFRVANRMDLWSLNDPASTILPRNRFEKIWRGLYRKTRRVFRGMRLINEWIKLTSYLLKARPDIIQFGKIEFPFEAFFLSILKRSGMPLSQICHEFELREAGNNPLARYINRLYHWVYRSFSILFFHAESNRERFASIFQVPDSQLHIIPHGNEQLFAPKSAQRKSVAETRKNYSYSTTTPVILFFGLLAPSKGLPDLLKAFALVAQKAPHARLLIAGKPSKHIELNDLLSMASELKISDVTTFDTRYIPIEEVASLMEMASVVLYPYVSSTQSGSLQVAYTFGRPVIATDVGGLPEAVEEGKSGFIVPPGSANALADAILKFIDDPGLTERMGAYAKHLSETRFSWKPIAQKILATYYDFLDQRRTDSIPASTSSPADQPKA